MRALMSQNQNVPTNTSRFVSFKPVIIQCRFSGNCARTASGAAALEWRRARDDLLNTLPQSREQDIDLRRLPSTCLFGRTYEFKLHQPLNTSHLSLFLSADLDQVRNFRQF